MKQYIINSFLMGWFIFGINQATYATNDATLNYQKESLNIESFDNEEWKSNTEGLKFTKKTKAQKIKKQKPTNNAGTGTLPPVRRVEPAMTFKDFAQTLLILLAVIVLAFVIFKAVAGDAILANKQVKHKRPISLSEIETNLHEADVEGFLKKALVDQDYRLAIRLYYLAIIKELSIKQAIEWKKDKTNGHYLREMRNKKHPKIEEFKDATRVFEYVWYSDVLFDGKKFEEVRINFKDLLTAIK